MTLKALKRYVPVSIDTKDPALAPLLDFASTAYPGQPLGHAVRELVIAGLGTDAVKPALNSARQSAFVASSYATKMRLAAALREIASDLDMQVALLREEIIKPCEVCGHVRSHG